MKARFLLSLILLAPALTGCQQSRSVYAASDEYQPRLAPVSKKSEQRDIYGELVRVALSKNTFVVRVANGMEQTFKFADSTFVMGLSEPRGVMRDLAGKEGSEVIVQWQDDEGWKLASRIDVTQLVTLKSVRRSRR